MSQNRIKKLLLSEYKDICDKILVESPFAETTRDGKGIREVALGLTPSKLIIATDVFRGKNDYLCHPNIDPSIESFELVSIYPLEYINLSVFRRRRRKTLKARLISGKANYYELGGMLRRNIQWKRWCEHIQILLSKRENGSSLSETSAASSSSTSTLYILSSDYDVPSNNSNGEKKKEKSSCRVWAHYGLTDESSSSRVWSKKDIYLGDGYNELGHGYYSPIPVRFAGTSFEDLRHLKIIKQKKTLSYKKSYHSWPNDNNTRARNHRNPSGGLCEVIFTREGNCKTEKHISPSFKKITNEYVTCGDHNCQQVYPVDSKKIEKKNSNNQKLSLESSVRLEQKLSRFGFGVNENCTSCLCLKPYKGDPDYFVSVKSAYKLMDPYKLIESGVSIWENGKRSSKILNNKSKHLRRYGLATSAHFLFALGPWSVHPGDKISIQNRRSSSLVTICRQPIESELRLPVSRRQLSGSVSMTSLETSLPSTALTTATRGRVILFWTPDYWYRPRAATAAYQELRKHLKLISDFQYDKSHKKNKNSSSKNFFNKRNNNKENLNEITNYDKNNRLFDKLLFSMKNLKKNKNNNCIIENSSISQLRRLLKINLKITAWDLDSTTIAKQLTIIDRDLFLRIPQLEIGVIVYKKSSRNAPNIGAWIAFSHRVSCLITSEILSIKKIDIRTRILARFINAANKCYTMKNYHSCRSILAGLQSPPIYRLKNTWSYLKTHHATRYETMIRLCRIFQSIRTDTYRRTWIKAEQCPPSIPYVGDLLIRCLGLDVTGKVENQPENKIVNVKDKCSIFLNSQAEIKQDDIIKNNTDDKSEQQSKTSFVKRIFSRILSTKDTSNKKSEYDIYWAAKQIILSRKYFDKWQTVLLTTKMIEEKEELERKNMNFMRKRVQNISAWLVQCQKFSQGYEFTSNSLAWEFLLKARYREDRENFILSKKLEPLLE
ncbi:hypothetical protein HCN44_004431 [Aphidius gifuensis]|uniref:Ras-GEF domain-containing protein n=1 Tax=Aphidius gifuensis TaxID=684658 RepID=A0A834Y0U3_APHGI|nr:hypothetical protein HCN44_004431 [Aphidius gifuensis]